ncbi:MAG: beta-hydroxyacyl-ACP dehydratase [Bacteroidales bacterium]|nr:beta-hydroxyacyl-ACP dehydratase [Bacteroidales bacterium]
MLTGLYDIRNLTFQGGNSYNARVIINPGDPVFSGHFPGQPVLPGVCTLAIVKDCICRVSEKKLRYCEMVQCKFTGMVDPSMSEILNIDFTLIRTEERINVNATVEEGGRVVMKMKAVMTEVFNG